MDKNIRKCRRRTILVADMDAAALASGFVNIIRGIIDAIAVELSTRSQAESKVALVLPFETRCAQEWFDCYVDLEIFIKSLDLFTAQSNLKSSFSVGTQLASVLSQVRGCWQSPYCVV